MTSMDVFTHKDRGKGTELGKLIIYVHHTLYKQCLPWTTEVGCQKAEIADLKTGERSLISDW